MCVCVPIPLGALVLYASGMRDGAAAYFFSLIQKEKEREGDTAETTFIEVNTKQARKKSRTRITFKLNHQKTHHHMHKRVESKTLTIYADGTYVRFSFLSLFLSQHKSFVQCSTIVAFGP